MSIKAMPILSDSSKNIVAENGTRSPYDKVIMDNRKRHLCSNQGGSHPMFHTISYPTSLPSSRCALPEHSYSAPVLYTNDPKAVIEDKPQDGVTTTTASSEKQFLPKIATYFVQEPSEFTKKGPQHQRVTSDDEVLATLTTLPSPATSVHDFPAVHHVKHSSPVRKISSSNLNGDNKNYPHHLTSSEGHLRNDHSGVGHCQRKGNHHESDEIGPISEHHTLRQRLLNFGLNNGTELIGHYAILKTIGSGSFSKVKLAIDLNSCKKVAIKMIGTKGIIDSERIRASVLREVELLKYIDHPNIVRLIDTVETPTHLCLVLEYVPGGELFDYVNDHYEDSTEEESKRIFLQLINIVEYLHENGIVHRDLKLENILIDSSNNKSQNGLVIKLTDFGLAKFINKSTPMLTTRCGSEEYAAPELISGKPYDGRKTDIWSLGIILYALLVGYLPFNLESGQSRKTFFSKIIRADFTFPNENESGKRSKISNEAKDLVKKILQSNSQKRLSLGEIKNHPWLKDV